MAIASYSLVMECNAEHAFNEIVSTQSPREIFTFIDGKFDGSAVFRVNT
jgi:hypothetical protein